MIMDIIAREYGWTLTEIRALPIPDVLALWKIIVKRKDLEKAASKKQGR